jgi:hypothetical protein
MEFLEDTEVQLLLLSSGEVKAVDPFVVSAGSAEIKVGDGGEASSFRAISTADDNTSYTSFDSGITGESISYTDHVVIVRYKRTKIVVIQEPSYGLLNFTEEDGWAINSTITGGVQALQTVQIASTAYINILQSQMLAIFASITAKSINAVYEWSTDGINWDIVEPNQDINPTQGNFQVRLRVINFFGYNSVAPYNINVRNTKEGEVDNDTSTTFNTTDVTIFALQYDDITIHELQVIISDDEAFFSPLFEFKVINLDWL